MKTPFTREESIVMNLIIESNNKFIQLNNDKAEVIEWNNAIHMLQDILGRKVLKRDYPDYYYRSKDSNY
jgi:hypothetical protein